MTDSTQDQVYMRCNGPSPAEPTIYGKKNKDKRYGLGAIGFWKNPFGWQPLGPDSFRFYANGAYFKSDADINFYNTDIAQATVGVWLGW